MELFSTHREFAAYGPSYWAVIAVFAIGATLLVWIGRRQTESGGRRLGRILGVLTAAIYGAALIYSLIPPSIDRSIPLHLTDLATVAAAYALWSQRHWAFTLTYYWGLVLSTQALISPDLHSPDFPHYQFLGFWAIHVLVVWAAIYLTWDRRMRPRWRSYRFVVVVTVMWAAVTFAFNTIAGTNYGFLNGKPATASLLDVFGPWPVYLLIAATLVLIVWALMTWPWERTRRPRRGCTKPSQATGTRSSWWNQPSHHDLRSMTPPCHPAQVLQHRDRRDVNVTSMIRCPRGRWAALLAVLALGACHSTSTPNLTSSAPSAPMVNQAGALSYTKAGSLYVSDPAGSPGRKLTDGPVDAQPAPSPDLSHVAFVRKADPSDYGGVLWVLDLSPKLEPLGPPRRLVDPATLPDCCDTPPQVVFPRWSPTGQQVAFVDSPNNGAVDGGILLVAAADTGALEPRQQVPGAEWAPYAGSAFAWSPDGSHIAWLDEHSDVRPVNVNALAAVGGVSTPVATDTDAFSVTYAKDGQAILFTNGEAPPDFVSRPFAVKAAGIYSVATPGGAVAKPPSRPTLLFTRQGSSYGNIAALDSGALAFTTSGTDDLSRTIQVLDKGSSLPRTTVTDVAAGSICQKTPRGGGVCHAVQRPTWGAGDFVAYLDTSPERSLVVTDLDNRSPRRVDTGVDTFAWAPPSRSPWSRSPTASTPPRQRAG